MKPKHKTIKPKHKKPITINPFTGKSNEVVIRQGISTITSDANGAVSRKEETRTVLKDKQHHLHFKIKLIKNWIYEKKHRKFLFDSEPSIKQLENQCHNMEHEYDRVSKLLKESKSV